MGLIGYNLNHYPLEAHYQMCRNYMYGALNWDAISVSIRENGYTVEDVSNAIKLFPHLELDANYSLLCYMTSEYHGIWGQIVAVKHDEPWHLEQNEAINKQPSSYGNTLHIPDCAVPAMEVLYNDGTPEGYLEVVLCSFFFQALPRTHFEQETWKSIINGAPGDFEEAWDCHIELSNWSPRYAESKITVLCRTIENGIGASSGRDRIYLRQFEFYSKMSNYMFALGLKDPTCLSTNHYIDDKRFNDAKRCCVFTQTSVLVAEQIYG